MTGRGREWAVARAGERAAGLVGGLRQVVGVVAVARCRPPVGERRNAVWRRRVRVCHVRGRASPARAWDCRQIVPHQARDTAPSQPWTAGEKILRILLRSGSLESCAEGLPSLPARTPSPAHGSAWHVVATEFARSRCACAVRGARGWLGAIAAPTRRSAGVGGCVPAEVRMTRDAIMASVLARVLAQVAHAAALRLPAEWVDDAAQEAWARWLAAGGEASKAPQQADASAYLVGIFHHVCADAVRAHRRRQRWCALAADLGVEPAELVDERPAAGLGGIARLLEQVVRPVFADLPAADVDLWIAAKVEGLGWQAAGEAAGMDRAAIARVRRRISRFLSAEGVLRRLKQRLDDVP